MTPAARDVVDAFDRWERAQKTQGRAVVRERLEEVRAAMKRLREGTL